MQISRRPRIGKFYHLTAPQSENMHFLQISRAPEKRCGERQFSLFWALLVGQPTAECVVIHADLGRHLSFTVARLLEISLERTHQPIWTNYVVV
jgi:hypothetical protein